MSNDTLHIAPLRSEHVDAAAEIERCSNPHPWSVRNFHDALQAGYLSLGAWQTDELLGFAILRPLLDEAELLLIAVAPSHRRRGVATRLWHAASATLRTAHIQHIHLEVRASNLPAQQLYTRLGFQPNGQRKHYYPSGTPGQPREDALLMKAPL